MVPGRTRCEQLGVGIQADRGNRGRAEEDEASFHFNFLSVQAALRCDAVHLYLEYTAIWKIPRIILIRHDSFEEEFLG